MGIRELIWKRTGGSEEVQQILGHGRVVIDVKSQVGVIFIKDMYQKYSRFCLMGI